jgi:hypothetical protein
MMMSVTAELPSAAGEFGEQGVAEFGAALATVLGEEEHQRPERIDIGALDELATALFRLNEPRLRKHREMCRKGTLAQARSFDELPRRKSLRFVPDELPEGVEPGLMRKSGEGEQGGVSIHASELSDGFYSVKTYRK